MEPSDLPGEPALGPISVPDRLHVLVVDDDAMERELYRSYLEMDDACDYNVQEAATGAEGIERYDSGRHDCILLDYCLPDIDGIRLIEEFADKTGRHVPVILLTGVGDERIAAGSLKAGAVDYIPKRDVSANLLSRSIGSAVEKHRLKTKLAEQARRVERQNADLHRKHEEIQRFYQNVSHEIKTPLMSMREFADILLDEIGGPLAAEQKEYVGLIKESCDELAAEIDELLELSRLESGKYRLEPRPLDIAELVQRAVLRLQGAARRKSIVLQQDPGHDLPRAYADPRRCNQILTNLLSNAIRFTAVEGEIRVMSFESASAPDHVTVAVTDTGCGIEEENLERIFERLFQAGEPGEHGDDGSAMDGLGLGLAIARRLVRIQGGELWVESEVGVGSTFAFSLPSCERAT